MINNKPKFSKFTGQISELTVNCNQQEYIIMSTTYNLVSNPSPLPKKKVVCSLKCQRDQCHWLSHIITNTHVFALVVTTTNINAHVLFYAIGEEVPEHGHRHIE